MDALLPELLLYISKDSYEVWIKLENSIAWFARYCRKNKLSYYNQFTERVDYPAHRDISTKSEEQCYCLYCFTRKNQKNFVIIPEVYKNKLYTYILTNDVIYHDIKVTSTDGVEDSFSGTSHCLPMIKYKFERDDKIIVKGQYHRDHEPAVATTNEKMYQIWYKLGNKHRIDGPAEITDRSKIYLHGTSFDNEYAYNISLEEYQESVFDLDNLGNSKKMTQIDSCFTDDSLLEDIYNYQMLQYPDTDDLCDMVKLV